MVGRYQRPVDRGRNSAKRHYFQRSLCISHDGLTNLLFPFREGVDIDIGRLAVWRLATHEQFGGTWLSDYIPNQLEGTESDEAEAPVMNL